jgi:hypothetical protein
MVGGQPQAQGLLPDLHGSRSVLIEHVERQRTLFGFAHKLEVHIPTRHGNERPTVRRCMSLGANPMPNFQRLDCLIAATADKHYDGEYDRHWANAHECKDSQGRESKQWN